MQANAIAAIAGGCIQQDSGRRKEHLFSEKSGTSGILYSNTKIKKSKETNWKLEDEMRGEKTMGRLIWYDADIYRPKAGGKYLVRTKRGCHALGQYENGVWVDEYIYGPGWVRRWCVVPKAYDPQQSADADTNKGWVSIMGKEPPQQRKPAKPGEYLVSLTLGKDERMVAVGEYNYGWIRKNIIAWRSIGDD